MSVGLDITDGLATLTFDSSPAKEQLRTSALERMRAIIAAGDDLMLS